MTKKEYMKPAIEFDEFDMEEELLAYSVGTAGLGTEDNLTHDETPGDSWNDALSRQGAWEE
jgi:hypothetical protein